MNVLRSKSEVLRFRVAAFLLFLKIVLVIASPGVLIHSIYADDRKSGMLGLAGVLLLLLVYVVQWMTASRTNCPLCMTPVLARRSCSKHNKARSFLGSHRLRVALSVMFKDRFICPYCLEPTVVRTRRRVGLRPTK
jgi:hypothetical protein